MESAPSRLESPLLELRKSLKKVVKEPTPNWTHDLRTQIRHARMVVRVALDDTRLRKRLLRSVKPLYKKAGKVRDMDVLTVFAAELQVDGEDACRARLLEALVARRGRAARKLRRAVAQDRPQLDRCLRRCAKRIEKSFDAPQDKIGKSGGNSLDPNPLALELAAKLTASPKLDRQNLHAYRAKVKELRYLLTLAGNENPGFGDRLRDVKDSIGAWHDWSELAAISSKILNHGTQCRLQERIEGVAAEHFGAALSQANALQVQAFQRAGRDEPPA
jgi:CHAD domain-containing protein